MPKEDPRAAFQRLDELFGQSLTGQDVQALFTFATHLGATVLGNLSAVTEFLQQCLDHPAEDDSEEMASLQRARMVIALCRRDEETVAEARAGGVRHAGEEAQVQALAAQTLIARMQFAAANEQLGAAAEALRDNEDPQQAGQIGALAVDLTAGAQQILSRVQQTVLRIADLAEVSFAGDERWQNRHQTLHACGRALWQSGKITAALEQVQRMLGWKTCMMQVLPNGSCRQAWRVCARWRAGKRKLPPLPMVSVKAC